MGLGWGKLWHKSCPYRNFDHKTFLTSSKCWPPKLCALIMLKYYKIMTYKIYEPQKFCWGLLHISKIFFLGSFLRSLRRQRRTPLVSHQVVQNFWKRCQGVFLINNELKKYTIDRTQIWGKELGWPDRGIKESRFSLENIRLESLTNGNWSKCTSNIQVLNYITVQPELLCENSC